MLNQPLKLFFCPNKITLVLLAISFISACSTDPCENASLPVQGNGGASLYAKVVEQEGVGRQGKPLSCISVLIFDTDNYADTLFNQVVELRDSQLSIKGLGVSHVDVIVDREGFYPVKYVDVALQAGENNLDELILMYRSSTPLVIPGELEVTLKENITLETIKPIYANLDKVKVSRMPGSYALRIPYSGRRLTRERVERLCRKLAHSQYVVEARPLANLTTVVPGL